MRRRILCTIPVAFMTLAVCGSLASIQTTAIPGTEEASSTKGETRITGEQENQDTTEAETGTFGEPYKVGIVASTLATSEDEFRGVRGMVQRYPDPVVHKILPENLATDKEDYISTVTSLVGNLEMKYILFNNGMEEIVPAFQTIRGKRPDVIAIVTSNDDPKLLNDYTDIFINTDWIRRGETISTKAYDMGAKIFTHCSSPTHMAVENEAKRRDVMKGTCEKLGMTWMEETTSDPQIGNGTAVMLQFLRGGAPRKIEQYEPNTNIFGANCPTYDVILDEAFKEKSIVAEQCYPTPIWAYPTVLNLEITKEGSGDYSKISNSITEKVREAGVSGRLSGWAVPSPIYIPRFQIELVKYMHDNSPNPEDVLDREFLNQSTSGYMPVAAGFQVAGEGSEHYYMLSPGDIYY